MPRFAFRIRSIPRTRRKAPIKQQASVCERDQRRISDFTYGSARHLKEERWLKTAYGTTVPCRENSRNTNCRQQCAQRPPPRQTANEQVLPTPEDKDAEAYAEASQSTQRGIPQRPSDVEALWHGKRDEYTRESKCGDEPEQGEVVAAVGVRGVQAAVTPMSSQTK